MLKLDSEFPGATGYLNTATMGLPPAASADELRSAISDWQSGLATAAGYDRYVGEARALFANMVNLTPDLVAIGSQVSAMTGMVAAGLKPGAQVVCSEEEFTSVMFPFLSRTDLNVKLVPLNNLEGNIGPETDLVVFSLVQSADGRVVDGKRIASAARNSGAMTLVDATQAAGWLPFNAGDYDVTVTGAYKWLLSPRGSAFMTVRQDSIDLPAVLHPGWYAGESPWDSIYGPPLRLAVNARRFDLSPGWLSWVGTATSLKYISEIGIKQIHNHNLALANDLRQRLGLSESDSAIVSLEIPNSIDVEQLKGFNASVRTGRLRLSFHLYNQTRDVDLVEEALKDHVTS